VSFRRTTLLIRADASPRIGAGHVMRCLALAQAWQDTGGSVLYTAAELTPGIAARLDAESIGTVAIRAVPGSAADAVETVEAAQRRKAACVVVDGYQFSGDYQRRIKESGFRLLVLDDYGHAGRYWADSVLNQNLHAQESAYCNREPYTRLLLGVRFVLLRREFAKWGGWQRSIPEVAQKLLVSFGGSDPHNVTLRTMEVVEQIGATDLETVVLAGPTNPQYETLQAAANRSATRFRLECNADDMPSLMAWADIAVGAAGSTSWERGFMGLPSLVVALAANQEPLARSLAAAGAVADMGVYDRLDLRAFASRLSALLQSSRERRSMADAGKQMVDGEGCRRVLMHLRGERIRLQKATAANCALLWRWANEPEVRSRSFHSEPIPWDAHVAWFEKKRRDPGCHFFIGFDSGDSPVGQVRFDVLRGDEAEIGLSVCNGFRGQGYGTELLQSAVAELLVTTSISSIRALIKPENQASVRVFERAGFEAAGRRLVGNVPALEYVCDRSRFLGQ